MDKSIKLLPSILSADFTRLGAVLHCLQAAGAQGIHYDVMDGHYVPNLSFGLPILKSIRPAISTFIDVHLMISNPLPYLKRYAEAGADHICVHIETVEDIAECMDTIRSYGVKAGFAVTPAIWLEEFLPSVECADYVLIMSVEPGFGGQGFLLDSLRKAEKLADYIAIRGLDVEIGIDGGINLSNVSAVIDAGCTKIVAGTALFAPSDETTANNVRAFLKIFEKTLSVAR